MKTAKRIALYQLSIGIAVALLWGGSKGWMWGLAAFTGGAISATLTFYTGLLNFGRKQSDPRQMVMNFYRAEARKIVLTAVLFGFFAQVFRNALAPLAVTFAATLLVYWFALLWKDDG